MDREASMFRSMVLKIPEVIIVHIKGKIVFANDYAAKLLGGSVDIILGHMVYEFISEDYQGIVESKLVEGNRKREAASDTINIVTLDKLTKTVILRAADIRWEGEQAVVFTLSDITEKKMIEDRLSESEERWKFALEGSKLGVWDWNVQTNEVYFSPKWKQILGYLDDELVNSYDTWAERLHPLERDAVVEKLFAHVNGKTPVYESEYRMLTKEGVYIWILDRGEIVSWTEDQKPLRFTGVHIDITENRESSEKLQSVNEELDNFFGVNLDLLCIADTNGYFLRLNNEWENTLGYTKEELMKGRFLDFVHPEDLPGTLECITELQKQIKILNFVNRYRCKDGSYKWLEWRSYPVGEKIYAAARDITSHKTIEQELIDKDNILTAVTKSLNILLTEDDFTKAIGECFEEVGHSIDVDRIYIFENCIDPETGKRCTSQKVEWNNTVDAKPQIDNPDLQKVPFEVLAEFEEACLKGEMFFGHVKNFSGTLHDILAEQNIISILIIPIYVNDYFWGFVGYDECGRERVWTEIEKNVLQTFAVSIANAIRRMQSNKELEAAKTAAEEASLAKGQFLANMSHEIRTPMNGILGIADLISETETTPEQKQYLDILRKLTESLLMVINDILDISKIEYGKVELLPEPFELDDTICDILRSVATPIYDKGIELLYEIAPEIPNNLIGDFNRLRQIIVNLLSNAMKFTSEGEIRINIEPVTIDGDDILLRFTVIDSGIGIPRDKLKMIFEPFTQADGTISRKYGGTGLGLSICSKLVSLMKGEIWAESKVGEGTSVIFTIWLKVNKDEVRTLRYAYPSIANRKVLIIGSSVSRSDVIGKLLINHGARIAALTDSGMALSEIGLKSAGPDAYDVALIDTNLPGNEAFTLYEQLRIYPGLKKVLLISSASKNSELKRCINSGMKDFIIKPINRTELLSAIAGIEIRNSEGKDCAVRKPGRSLRVLVAEDNEVNQLLTTRLLEKLGCSYKVAANGIEALEYYDAEVFDLLLMDVQMPEMDGYTATSLIRKKEQATGVHVPIVALTAHAMQGDQEKSLAAGMDYHLTKPLQSDKLGGLIDEIFPFSSDKTVQGKEKDDYMASMEHEYSEKMITDVLEKLDHDYDFLMNVIAVFEDDSAKLLRDIRESVRKRDGAELKKSAHSLKGAIAFFNMGSLYQYALSLENMGREECFDQSEELADLLEEGIRNIILLFRQYPTCKK